MQIIFFLISLSFPVHLEDKSVEISWIKCTATQSTRAYTHAHTHTYTGARARVAGSHTGYARRPISFGDPFPSPHGKNLTDEFVASATRTGRRCLLRHRRLTALI